MSYSPNVNIQKRLQPLIPKFLEYQQENLTNMKSALNRKSLEEIAKIGHIIRGSAGGYGFHDLGMIGDEIEKAASSGNIETTSAGVEAFESYLSSLQIVFI